MHREYRKLDQTRVPLLEGLLRYRTEGIVPFHTPGHKQGRVLDQGLRDALGEKPFFLDISDEIFDQAKNHDSAAVIKEAEALAADAFGAKQSFFLHNGTTAGIQAMLLACAFQSNTGKAKPFTEKPAEIILPRSVHRSVFSGLMLAGLMPRFVKETWDTKWGIALPPTPKAWQDAADDSCNPVGIFDTYPNYYGIGGDLKQTASIAHGMDRPLIVDEAHGAHFPFHPKFPPSALSLGAAAAAQSAHKTLGVLTQASLLHTMDEGLTKVMPMILDLLQSTSPSFLLYASLDAGRRQMVLEGRDIWDNILKLGVETRKRINDIPGLVCLGDEVLDKPGAAVWDPTKLLIRVDELGLTGAEAELILRQYGIQVELAGFNHILVLLAVGDGPQEVKSLVNALRMLAASAKAKPQTPPAFPSVPAGGVMSMAPREALLAARRQVTFEQAEGEIAADIVTPYPPGIPLFVPGEKITGIGLGYLESYLRQGIEVRGWADLNRKTIWVVDDY
ncbi:MAG: arginine decarboxylase [Firmicutes bacterium]|nr:arginine decarboxylase [Bacillota bacterium]